MIGAILVAAPAAAKEKRFSLRYESSAGCPSEAEFIEMVRGHTKRWTLVPEGSSPELMIRVRASAKDGEASGNLTVTTPGSTESGRDVDGADCAEVSQALALMVGVLLDPQASRAQPPPPASPPSPPPPSPAPPPPLQQPSLRAGQQIQSARTPEGPTLSFDLRFETTSAVVRGGLPGIGASVAIEAPRMDGPRWLRVLRPSLGLGVRQSLPNERDLPQGSARITWTAGNARLCPFRLAITSEVELSPCAEMNLGALGVSASRIADARSVSTNWLDVGGSIWATVALTRRLFFSSTVLFAIPLDRQPFTTDSGVSVASVPPRGVLVGVGLGAKMWPF